MIAWMIAGQALLLALPVLAEPAPYPLPPASEIPEEVLRLEDPGYGTSPVNGERLGLGEYARLMHELQEAQEVEPQINPKLKQLIFLLRLRKFLKTFVPFL